MKDWSMKTWARMMVMFIKVKKTIHAAEKL